MSAYYSDYVWQEGIPVGKQKIDPSQGISYKIAMDPYRKRISIEKYVKGAFEKIIYDSALLDFRQLKPSEQIAWQRTVIEDTPEKKICLIRNQDDRLLFIEEYQNRECSVKSVHGYPLSIHKVLYESLGDPFNGVILYDINQHPIMYKKYKLDPETRDFGELLEESWTNHGQWT